MLHGGSRLIAPHSVSRTVSKLHERIRLWAERYPLLTSAGRVNAAFFELFSLLFFVLLVFSLVYPTWRIANVVLLVLGVIFLVSGAWYWLWHDAGLVRPEHRFLSTLNEQGVSLFFALVVAVWAGYGLAIVLNVPVYLMVVLAAILIIALRLVLWAD